MNQSILNINRPLSVYVSTINHDSKCIDKKCLVVKYLMLQSVATIDITFHMFKYLPQMQNDTVVMEPQPGLFL